MKASGSSYNLTNFMFLSRGMYRVGLHNCANYRGITLLSTAGKILARVLLNRLVPSIAADHIPESQYSYRANRSTTDMAFALRQPQEKCREPNKGLYITFVGLRRLTLLAGKDFG